MAYHRTDPPLNFRNDFIFIFIGSVVVLLDLGTAYYAYESACTSNSQEPKILTFTL